MNRKEFLSLLGLSAGSLLLVSCLDSCKKHDTTSKLTRDFTLDLTSSANAALNPNGGYFVSNGVIVAKTTAGNYIAVTAACTHNGTTIQYDGTNNRFHCPNHGANFTNAGAVVNGPATVALQQFNTQLNGTSLRIFS